MKDLKPKLGASSPLGAKTKGKFEVAPRKIKDSASQQDGDKQKVFFFAETLSIQRDSHYAIGPPQVRFRESGGRSAP